MNTGLNAIELRISTFCRHIGHAQGEIVGSKIERDESILEVKGRGAVLVFQKALLDRNVAGLEIEKFVEYAALRLFRRGGVRLVGRAVRIDNQMQPGPVDFQVSQQDARAQEAQHTQPHAQAFDLGVGRLARAFEAVDDQPISLCLPPEQIPVEGADFDASASGNLQPVHHPSADKVFKTGCTGQEI